ncbi:ESPR-type extended signal peptide-containing protein [Dialister invisus]|uniref:ESPR-type extended signal peptide-containing protein n=1 Tax=Dialister invisus TaxID=218538 RepID=UPI00351F9518
MNQIYKVIWSRVRRCYVVVSEIAGSCGKNGGVASKKESLPFRAFLCALALTGCLMPGVAEASFKGGNGAVVDPNNSIAVGDDAQTAGQYTVALGSRTRATNIYAIAIGDQAKATGQGATAIGSLSLSTALHSLAVGDQAHATAVNSSAYGLLAKASGLNSVALGSYANASRENTVSIGYKAGNDMGVNASGDTVLIGMDAGSSSGKMVKHHTSDGKDLLENGGEVGNHAQVAIGYNAGKTVNGADNIAIGRQAGQNTVGNTNVALSTNAGQNVDGHDNFAALLSAGKNIKGISNIAIGKNAGRGTGATILEIDRTIALGEDALASKNNAAAIGYASKAAALNSVAVGNGASVGEKADNGIAIGKGAKAEGESTTGTNIASGTVAVGQDAQALENGDVVIGRQAKTIASTYHGNPGSGAVVAGAEAAAYGARGDVVIGASAETNVKIKQSGGVVDAKYAQGVAIGSTAKTYGTQSLALGADTRAIGNSSVAIGGDDIDMARTELETAVPQLKAGNGIKKSFNKEIEAKFPGGLGSASINVKGEYANTAAIGDATTAIGTLSEAFGTGSTAIGINSLTKGVASTGIGIMARSWGDNSLALGTQVGAYGTRSSSIGDTNQVGLDMKDGSKSGKESAAVGSQNTIYGNQAYAIGAGNTIGSATVVTTTEANGSAAGADQDKITTVTAGTVKGNMAGAFGYKNTINADNAYAVGSNSMVSADGAMVLGNNASVTAKNGMALGSNTKVANENAVALGAGSETAAAVKTSSATINGVAHNFAGVNPASTVSVGKAGSERTITNVAAGRISDTSTDAINGSQLYAVTTEVDKGVAYAGDVKGAGAADNKFTQKLGEQTNIIGGVTDTSKLTDGNIGVVSNGTDTLNIKLAKDLKVDSVTAGNTVINNNGLTVGGNTYVTNNGINANNAPITNVASGGTTDSNAANIGDVKKAAAGAKATVTGDKQATVTNTTAADGHVDYVVSATKTTLAAEAGGKVSVTGGTEDANGVIAYTVGLDAATKTAINNIGGGTIAAGDNKTVTGDTVNTYLNNNYYDKPTMDTKLGDKANTNLDNITNAGKTVINDIAADAVKVVNGKNTTVTPGTEAGANGTVKTYAVNVSGDLTGITSISNQKTAPGGTTTGAKITLGDTTNTVDVGGAKITNVADGDVAPNSKDAVNGGQLNEVKELAGKHTIVKVDGQENRTDGNLLITKTDNNGQATYDLKLNDELTVGKTGAAGKDGSIGVKGKDGSAVAINGKDGSIGLNGANGANGLTMKSGDAKPAVDGTNVTRLVLEENGKKHDVATLDDGLKFTGNNTGTVNNHKLNTLVKVQGEGVSATDSDNFASASGNINVKANGTDTLELQLAKDLKNLDSVTAAKTVKAGDAVMGGQTVTNTAGDNETGNYVTGLDNKTWNPDKIVSGRAATEDQVKDAIAAQTATGLKFDANVGGVKTNKLGSTVLVKGEGTAADNDYSGENIKTFITQDNDGNTTINVKMNRNLVADSIKVNKNGKDAKDGVTLTGPDANGTDGKVGISGKDGKDAVSMSGKDGIGHIGLNGKDGRNADMTVDKGTPDLDGNEITRIKYTDEKGTPHEVATKDDGMKYGGDTGAVIKKKLNEQVNVIGGIADETKLTTDDNIGVVSDGSNNLKVRLAKALKGLESVTTGDTVMNNNGVTINNGAAGNTVSLTKDGLDNGGNKITNVAAGDVSANSTDAVNGSQLHEVKTLAGQHTTVKAKDANITVTEGTNAAGGKEYTVGLGDKVTLGSDPSKQVSIDGTTGIIKAGDKVTIDGTTGNIDAGKVKINGKDGTVNELTNKTWDPNNFTSGQAATEDQLKAVDQKITNTSEELTKKGMDFAGDEGEFHRNLGEKVTIKGEGTKAASEYSGENIKTIADENGNITVKMDKNLKTETIVATGKDGKDGKIGINGKDGKTTNISVTRDGKPGVDGAPGTTTTRIVYQNPDGTSEEVATLNDGMKYGGDTGAVIKKKLNEQVNVVGGITDTNKLTTEDNLGVVSDGNNNLKVRMAKDLKGLNSVTTNTLTVGDVKIDNSGINAGNKKITNVAAGDISANSTDAVNGGQLWKTNQTINNIGGAVNELGDRMDRVGAGAAALAALHPLDFDPDDKWDVAAGYGNYKDAHAVAVGAFYRPNEDTMFSVGGSFGGGDNMVNAGVSLKLGQGNHVSTSRVALAKEVEDLKAIVKAQSAEIKAMRGAMQSGTSVMKDVNFPDVPKDHWAYSYVKSLADRGLLEGYPDGEFKGDRSMTRYEFAAIIYRALQNGAPIDSNMAKAIGEFDPEINRIKDLDRTRVDRISGKDNDRHKVERVRVNNESNKEKGDYRDVYGSHISPEA